MRVLVVSQYFAPEPGATQNRMTAFSDGLVARGHELTVVCEQPNHPAGVFHPGYGRRPVITERQPGLTIRRLWVAASPTKTTMRRLAFYGTFSAGAFATVAARDRPDVAFITSPPLPGALAAAAACKLRGVPFVLDVRDLWPAAAEALGELTNPRLLGVFQRAERWVYQSAAAVTATTGPFCRHINAVAGRQIAVELPNGALDELVALPDTPPPADGPFTVAYAGNIGIAQGLWIVLDAAEELARRNEEVRFLVVGDGPLSTEFRAERDRRELSNVEVRPGIPVNDVAEVLLGSHALLIPLGKHEMLGDFIPSKLYDAMAVGRPALVATTGEAAELTRTTGCGLVVPPEDGHALAEAIVKLKSDPQAAADMGRRGRAAAPRYARSRQVDRLEAVLLNSSWR